MGKQLTSSVSEMSYALHALAYELGRAQALRENATRVGIGSTRRAYSRNALKAYLIHAPIAYKDLDQLAVSYGEGYRAQCNDNSSKI